jgi:MFS family permease
MGVGRFAYTALLPSVQHGLGFDDAAAGLIASANLVGYLVGVLWARHTPTGWRRRWLLRAGLALSVLTTALVVSSSGVGGWATLRFLGGVASGLVFVLISAAVLEAIPDGRDRLSGVLYGGVGVGIALSGATAALTAGEPWPVPWLLLAGLSAGLALPGLLMSPGAPVVRPAIAAAGGDLMGGLPFGRLALSYALEGLGYIVSGTFVVAAVQHSPGLEPWAPWVWVATGLAALPSALVWGALARRLGSRRALILAFAAQAMGMALPALSGSAAAALLGALLFGGTFVGIVVMTMDAARRLAPSAPVRIIGTLTALYGVGQAIGPFLAGRLTQAVGSPHPSVLAASAAVALGAVVLALPAPRPTHPK